MLITVCDDKNSLGEQAAERGGRFIRKAIAEKGECKAGSKFSGMIQTK